MADPLNDTPAWSLPRPWLEFQRGAAPMHLAASPDVLTRVARAIGAQAVKSLEADLVARPWLNGVEIKGGIKALVTRICGVTLEEFDETIDERFSIRIVPAGSANAPEIRGGEVSVDPGADDPPDELAGDSLDIGSYVVEHLALALSPFPRKLGAIFEPLETPGLSSPFAALAQRGARPKKN